MKAHLMFDDLDSTLMAILDDATAPNRNFAPRQPTVNLLSVPT